MQNNSNGNSQLNMERANVNKRVSNLSMLSSSRMILWNNKRRFRTI